MTADKGQIRRRALRAAARSLGKGWTIERHGWDDRITWRYIVDIFADRWNADDTVARWGTRVGITRQLLTDPTLLGLVRKAAARLRADAETLDGMADRVEHPPTIEEDAK